MLDAILAQSRNTALIMGLIAFIGLILQKKSVTDVVSGTMKTIIGFMVFNIGSSAMSTVVTKFTELFNTAFGIEGVTTQVEVATGLALNTYGTEVAMVMLLGFVMNLLFAKFTKFKAIFLTGQHFLYFACVIALVFIANGMPTLVTVIVGGTLLGLCGAALPTLCQPFMNKITGADNLAMGHFNCIGYAFSGYVGKLIGKMGSGKEHKDASDVKMPKFFEIFRDFIFSVALFMVVLFYIAVIACVVTGKMDVVKASAGNDIWFIYPLLQGLQFAAGMSVLIYGVRQFIAEITAAFVAISEKYIPNSKPAVDCPAIFPFAPTAVLIGFVGAFLGGLAAMGLMVAFDSSVIMIPAAGICFFSGGTCGIFGNAYGGWKGALIGSFIVGMALTGLPLILYPAFAQLGIAGASFPNVDYNIIGSIVNWILGLF
ncbi:PTS ascorbate transporter subunit IIC [Clostridium sp.]|uniref:PTS ascorbate transporter subunit IIC n=1 Tax=Clostridium sp. TaxID=1506 RepID=UPI00290EA655|nr:PTS ascorbate transporter subunit IIC [Clostridium sp.]MDU5105916.1 PTS ascorbate transporter subunit IIC [Clostridium sp.]